MMTGNLWLDFNCFHRRQHTRRSSMPDPDQPMGFQSDRPKFLTSTRFAELGLPQEVMMGISDAGFDFCTPIQAQVLPVSLAGKDIAGQAQTGTGKTAAFLVTVYTRIMGTKPGGPGQPSALILAPTRELALQIYNEACLLGRHTGLTAVPAVGGIDYRKQADDLKKGADIAICTPGRLIDYMKQGIFQPSGIRIVVIDEADRLLDLGFAKDIRYILRKLPHYDRRQTLLFSATLSYRVLELTYDYMNLPEFISVTPDKVTVEGIDQVLYHLGRDDKLPFVLGFLKNEAWSRILIFANTRHETIRLAESLHANGWEAQGITGELDQKKRLRLMEQFKSGDVRILVATDVASRGIHVEDVSHVINYDIPQDPENYIHRIGRTARAGKSGCAITLACEAYVYYLEAVEDLLGYKIPVGWVEEDRLIPDRFPAPDRRRWKKAGASAAKPAERSSARRPRRSGVNSKQGPPIAKASKPDPAFRNEPGTGRRRKRGRRSSEKTNNSNSA